MTGWTTHTGAATLLAQENIDTDQLISARFMSVPRAQGYGEFLLYDQRYDPDGTPTDHPLNHARPTILIAGRNFGSGSSREAAVYALVDFGIRAVLAPSFGDIFASNAVNNGLLPARIRDETFAALAGSPPGEIAIDLQGRTLAFAGKTADFKLEPVWQTKLINGWDDIDLTHQHTADISAFEQNRQQQHPWSWPGT